VLLSIALVTAACSLFGILQEWASNGPDGSWGDTERIKQFGMVQAIPALIACVIGIGAWSPFGEFERTAASSLPRLRLLHIALLLVLGVSLSWAFLSTWTFRAPGVELEWVAVRNLLGMTGVTLAAGRFIDARLGWLAPLAFAVIAVYRAMAVEPNVAWAQPDWVWNGQDQASGTGWLIALAMFAIGTGLYLRDGARDASGEEE
jgi:hypothetical protein